MKIIVLDGYTLNPGDLSWDNLCELGDTKVYDRTDEKQILARAENADILLTNKTPLTSEIMSQLKNLKYIGMLATGYDVVNTDAASKCSIPVCNVPNYGTNSVAQMAFAHILNLVNRVHHHAGTVVSGKWSRCPDFCYWDYSMVGLEGLTLGILGYGRIGHALAKLGRAFGMSILTLSGKSAPGEVEPLEFVSIEDLFSKSDILSLHCPLTPNTENIVNAGHLALMKKSAFLINTSRGGLVCDTDLADALNNGMIAGAGLDVVSNEPIHIDNPLLKAQNCFITPHIAWATKAARKRLMDIAVENIRCFLKNQPQNVVNLRIPFKGDTSGQTD